MARLGGDEFFCILAGCATVAQAASPLALVQAADLTMYRAKAPARSERQDLIPLASRSFWAFPGMAP